MLDIKKSDKKTVINFSLAIITSLIILLMFALAEPAHPEDLSTSGKIINGTLHSTWLQDRTIKYGLLTSFCIAQGTTGLVESAKYGGHYLSNSADDYHVYRGIQNIAWIGTGYFTYAVIQENNKSWWAKASRIVGSACYARNCNELVYRWNVSGSPFNYSDAYTSNKKALVLLKWDGTKGSFVDFYVSGTGKQGMIIDASFFVVGFILTRIGDIR